MDRKRVIDGNMHKIHEQYDELKRRIKDEIDVGKKERAMLNLNTLRQTTGSFGMGERGTVANKKINNMDTSVINKYKRMAS